MRYMKEIINKKRDFKIRRNKTMANIYKGTLGLIGNTPLVEDANIEKELGLKARE